jgi:acetyl esterase/lipase
LRHADITIGPSAKPRRQRYKDIVFSDISIEEDLSYNPGAAKDAKKAYLFDLYQPKSDDAKGRPLIIWMHGGGFKYGSKTAKGVKSLEQHLCPTRLCVCIHQLPFKQRASAKAF